MPSPQDIINNLQFAHSVWFNEIAHDEVELLIMANRLDLLDATAFVPEESQQPEILSTEIDQMLMAAKFIKQEILKHIHKINNLAKLNGQLDVVKNSIHQETKERITQFRSHFKKVKEHFYQLIPIADQI